jgi:hypothetical protein
MAGRKAYSFPQRELTRPVGKKHRRLERGLIQQIPPILVPLPRFDVHARLIDRSESLAGCY